MSNSLTSSAQFGGRRAAG